MVEHVEIDLRTRVWNDDERIFVLFPGREHRFYDTFLNRSIVFLDVPALQLNPGIAPQSHKDYAARLKLSDEVRIWHDKQREGAAPSRDLATYAKAQIGKQRALLAGQVKTLYADIHRGDVIVVPGKNYFSDVLIGEVLDGPLEYVTAQIPEYPNEQVLARRVRWVARKPKWELTPDLIRRLQIPNPLTLLERSLWNEILRFTYENYVFEGRFNARFLTKKPDFSSIDSLNIEYFLNNVAAIYAALDIEDGGDGDGITDIDEAIDLLLRYPEYAPELMININSPGDISAFSKHIVPLIIAALLTLALAPESAAAPSKIKVVNSTAPSDSCAVVVDARVKQTINMMGYEKWQEQCRRLKGTAERTGLQTQSRIVRPPPPPPPPPKR